MPKNSQHNRHCGVSDIVVAKVVDLLRPTTRKSPPASAHKQQQQQHEQQQQQSNNNNKLKNVSYFICSCLRNLSLYSYFPVSPQHYSSTPPRLSEKKEEG
jgi:hypothetical protein